jgi:cytochrome c2
MTNINSAIFAGLILAGSTASVWAQEVGDVRQGAAFAQAACSQCHAVGRNNIRSPNRYAPNFRTVARAPGIDLTGSFCTKRNVRTRFGREFLSCRRRGLVLSRS